MKITGLPPFKNMEDKELIQVGICTHNMSVNMQIANWIEALVHLTHDPHSPYVFKFDLIHGFRPIPYARNVLAGKFIKAEDASRLWFIDSDMLPQLSLFKLLTVDADICCGLMYGWNDWGNVKGLRAGPFVAAYMKNEENLYTSINPGAHQEIAEVDAVGTASMLIRRKVLLDFRLYQDDEYTLRDGTKRRHRDDRDKEHWAPPIFQEIYRPNNSILMGSDIEFCERAKKLGYSIKIHLGAEINHLKPVIVDDAAKVAGQALELGLAAGQQGEVYGKPEEVADSNPEQEGEASE